ncbi:DUF5514 family protein, partial [Bacillus cereus]|nr:DUF5514 family protein [Bacillus cereus]
FLYFNVFYCGCFEVWNVTWGKGKQTYEKIYFKLAL